MAATTELAFLSAAEQGRSIRAHQLSPVDLVQRCPERIERHDRVLRAYVTACVDPALETARAAEREIMAGHYHEFARRALVDLGMAKGEN